MRAWKDVRDACNRHEFTRAFDLLHRNQGQARDYRYVIQACMEAHQLDAVGQAVLDGLRRSGNGSASIEGNDGEGKGKGRGAAVEAAGQERALPKGIRPVDLINQLLDSHSKAGRFEQAWLLFEDVIEPLPASSQPTTISTAAARRAHSSSRSNSCSTDIQQPSRALLRPSPKTYSILLTGCARWNKNVEAMFLVKDAAKRNVPLTEGSLLCAMQACANAGDSQNARQIMREMEARNVAIPRPSLQRLLVAQALRGEVKANEDLLEALGRGTPGGEVGGDNGRGGDIRVADYVCAGFHARALEAYDALLPPPEGGRQREDYAAALTAATALKDAKKVAEVLEEMEARLNSGDEGGVIVGPTELGLACRVLRREEVDWEEEEEGGEERKTEGDAAAGSVQSEEERREGDENEKQMQQRRCLEVVGRLISRSNILFLNSTYAQALLRAGREEEARKLSERLLAHRMGEGESPAWKQLTSYASQMVALGVLGQWPVAHYLYDEMRCRPGSRLAGRDLFLLRALMKAYQMEEDRAELAASSSNDSSNGKTVLHDMALRAYQHAYAEGYVDHWSTKRPQMMDVHRYSLYLARLAVETVLQDLLAKPWPKAVGRGGKGGGIGRGGEGGRASATSLRDLWIVTGAGKHDNTFRIGVSETSLKPLADFQSTTVDSVDRQEENSNPYNMTLRNKLARVLALEHGLFSAEDLEHLSERGDGRLRIRKEAIRVWLARRRECQKGDQLKKTEEPKRQRVVMKKELVW